MNPSPGPQEPRETGLERIEPVIDLVSSSLPPPLQRAELVLLPSLSQPRHAATSGVEPAGLFRDPKARKAHAWSRLSLGWHRPANDPGTVPVCLASAASCPVHPAPRGFPIDRPVVRPVVQPAFRPFNTGGSRSSKSLQGREPLGRGLAHQSWPLHRPNVASQKKAKLG